jgi:hypothetical protein
VITLQATDENGASSVASVSIEVTEEAPETIVAAPTCNELDLTDITLKLTDFDSDQPGDPDTGEYVEVTNNGTEAIALGGCSLVFFDGATSASYFAADLGGTVEAGASFRIGNPGAEGISQVFANNTMQDGPDALALYKASASDFPNNTPVTTNLDQLLSAIVYISDDNIYGSKSGGVVATVSGSELVSRMEEIASETEQAEKVPERFALGAGYPNPFTTSTTIRFATPERTDVELVVYDVLGREVKRLVDRSVRQGRHEVQWDGRDASGTPVASGIYFYRITTESFTETRSVQLVR